jgi:imidazole glycerol-phosphate synthase subunit HisH
MRVLIVDYGMGNLGSLRRSLEECGASVSISTNPADVTSSSHLIVPGVGAFPDAMRNLRERGWVPELEAAVKANVPLLGICLGMQLLAEKGYEGEETTGLGFVPGVVRRLEPASRDVRLPHVGWNEVHQVQEGPLFAGVRDRADFYFVHSYHFVTTRPEDVLTTTDYCGGFVSTVHAGTAFGVQFHPEKSSRAGFQVLRNFLKL